MAKLACSPEQIGNAIRRARKKRGMSQAELGEKTGLRQGTISLIEKGHAAAKLETILAVLSALDLDLRISERTKQTMLADALRGYGKK
jgi:HTH-type transcriptional regulator/antitoxin HipB